MNKNTMEKKIRQPLLLPSCPAKGSSPDRRSLLQQLGSSAQGLTADQVEKEPGNLWRKQGYPGKEKVRGGAPGRSFINPFTVILFVLAGVSAVTDIILPLMQNRLDDYNPATVIIITVLVLLSGSCAYPGTRGGDAAAKLLELITTTCTVIRQPEGQTEIPLEDVVVGDLVFLSAGDMFLRT